MQQWNAVAQAIQLGGWVMYPLCAMAVLALTIVLERLLMLWRYTRMPRVLHPGAAGAAPLAPARMTALPAAHVWRRLAATLHDCAHEPQWWAQAQIEAVAAEIDRELKRGLWVLETIVTAAPLLGLLGTIVGMMESFRLLGGAGLVNPTGVTGGVAQALIATALGLVIALTALFAFNYLSRHTDDVLDRLEAFCNRELNASRLRQDNRRTAGGTPP